jgi:hypothetical protein
VSRAARVGVVAVAIALVGVLHAGCGSDAKELFTRPFDAGTDADAGGDAGPAVDPTLGGPCTEDGQCDDTIACTFDSCDKTLLRCRNVPDDSLCADPLYCNGREKCVLRLGCAAGPVVTCQDDDPCTVDRCVEATKGCEHAPRDLDGDGDPDNHCVGSRDCDDLDPDVGSNHAEVCGNGKDDNCNGIPDESPCVAPANDVCETALAVTLAANQAGTFLLSTEAARRDYSKTGCPQVKTPTASKDVVLKIAVPAGAPQDVEIWANAQQAKNEVAVALRAGNGPADLPACKSDAAEVACGHVAGSASARAIARNQAGGSVVYAIVTTQLPGAVDVKVRVGDVVARAANESCVAPADIPLDTPITVALIDPVKDLPSACDSVQTGELTYSFTLPGPGPADVKIFASTLVGSGQPLVSLRDASCADELRCHVGPVPPVFARGLAPGPHVLTVSGTQQIDASLLVKAYPATAAPNDQSCATATPLVPNTTFAVDLSAHEDAIKNGCLPGGPSAAYTLDLAVESDVLVIGRFPPNEAGSVSLSRPGCGTADLVVPPGCAAGPSPQRVSARKVPAGSYRVVVADQLGQTAQLTVLVRPTVAPTDVGLSDNCVTPFTLPATGGFFIGDTTNSSADFNAGCDAPGQPIGGAKDQIMKLSLAQKQRVVLDMVGSSYTTILDVRQGPTCPATELPNACFVGFNASKSFLDVTLDPGTYWVQVDGYNGDKGPWNLDMRVLPP